MAWKTYMGCVFDLRADDCMGGDFPSGACKVFEEMPTSEFNDWRPPNHILEVTINRVFYPITESLIRQLFGPFGVVEIYLCKGLDRVEARVVFETIHQAVEAFGELHGRNIYDGCCQMDIKWGLPLERDVSMVTNYLSDCTKPEIDVACEHAISVVTRDGNIAASSWSVSLPSATTASSALDDLNSEKLPMAAAIGEHGEASGFVAVSGGIGDAVQSGTILDVVERDVADELQALAASTITEEHVPVTMLAVAAAPTIDIDPNGIDIEVPANNLMRFSNSEISILVPVDSPDTILILEPPSLSLLLHVNQSVHHMFDESALSMQWLEQQPWPPPTQLEPASVDADLRPMPWPSFLASAQTDVLRHEGEMFACCGASCNTGWAELVIFFWIVSEASSMWFEQLQSTIPVLLSCQVGIVLNGLIQLLVFNDGSSLSYCANIVRAEINSFLDDTSRDKHLCYLCVWPAINDQLVISIGKDCNSKGDVVPGDNFIKSNISCCLKSPFMMLHIWESLIGVAGPMSRSIFTYKHGDRLSVSTIQSYQERPERSLGFHCYIFTYTVSMTTQTLIDTHALVIKISPQELAAGKNRLQVDVLAAISEHSCLLVCSALLMRGAGCFLQIPWDPGGSQFLFDGMMVQDFSILVFGLRASMLNSTRRFTKIGVSSEFLQLQLECKKHLPSYGWLMVFISDRPCLCDLGGIAFAPNVPLYRLGGKPIFKKGGMLGTRPTYIGLGCPWAVGCRKSWWSGCITKGSTSEGEASIIQKSEYNSSLLVPPAARPLAVG